jgi:hypothetical protein
VEDVAEREILSAENTRVGWPPACVRWRAV